MDSKSTPWIVALSGSILSGGVAVLLYTSGRLGEGLFASALGITTAVIALVFQRSASRSED